MNWLLVVQYALGALGVGGAVAPHIDPTLLQGHEGVVITALGVAIPLAGALPSYVKKVRAWGVDVIKAATGKDGAQ